MSDAFHEEAALGKVYDARLMARLWPFVRPYRAWIGLSLLLIPVRAVLELLPAVVIAAALDHLLLGRSEAALPVLDFVVQPRFGLPVLGWSFALLMMIAAASLSLEWLRAYSMIRLGQETVRDVRRKLFDHVQKLPMSFFDRYPVGRLVTRLTNDLENLAEMFSSGVVALIADLFLMIFFAVVLLQLDSRLALAAFAVVPFLAVAAAVFRYKVRAAFREVRVKIARLNAQLQETITGIRVIQLFQREGRNAEEFARWNASHRDSWFRSIRYDALLFSSVDLSTNLARALIFFVAAALLAGGGLTLGVVYVFIETMSRFFRPLMDLSAKYSIMQSSMASAERVFQLLDEPVAETRPQGWQEGCPDLTASAAPVIEFDRVTFGYGERPVLRDVSFTVRAGQNIALVGPTGSGKTTTLKLLAGLYPLTEGEIRLGGRGLEQWPNADLRRAVGYVTQDVMLFEDSLRENLALGATPSEERFAEIVRSARLQRVVDGLDDGLDTRISEGGGNLSSGERQLVAFGRALLRAPDVLLLDEATASIDTDTEVLIQQALAVVLRQRTSLVVAHRLSTIRDADMILVFQQGAIVERGTHEELLAGGGLYSRLHALQFAREGSQVA